MTSQTIFLFIIGAIISWIIFYYVVKAAVRNGMREANAENRISINHKTVEPEKNATPEQIKLQKRYENGEMSFEVYQEEWNRLKR